MIRRVVACLVVLTATGLPSVAQQFAPTTVQLPTFSFFTVQTTVAVPDSGYGFAHGPCQVSHGWTAYGPAWGASTTHWETVDEVSMWSFGAQTIDLAAMDAELLASATPLPALPAQPLARQLSAPPMSTAARVPGSVADARRARAAALAAEAKEIDDLIAKAEALLAQGKPKVARVYLQMAAGKATGERRQTLEARAAALKAPPAR